MGLSCQGIRKASAVIKKAWEWVKKFFGIKDETTARQTADLEKNTKATQANTKAKTANAQTALKNNKKQNAPSTDSGNGSGKSGNQDKYSGKKLIANATSYKELGNNIQYYQNKLETANGTDTKTIALYAKKSQPCKAAGCDNAVAGCGKPSHRTEHPEGHRCRNHLSTGIEGESLCR